jgi:DNA-directed RNA polymerase I, II, and III subunit RPABC2
MSDYGGDNNDEPYASHSLWRRKPANEAARFDDRFDADPFIYEDEELEPPPLDDREDAMDDEGQMKPTDESAKASQNVVNGVNTQNQDVIVSGDVGAANTPGSKAIPPEERSTTPYMTKYEKARILGTRALQIRYMQY